MSDGKVKPIPEGMHSITPHLVCAGSSDAIAFYTRAFGAVAAGARVIMPVADMFWGDRYGVLEDPFGHRWSIATHIRDATPAETQDAMTKMAAESPRKPG
jgi:hypothetical protein